MRKRAVSHQKLRLEFHNSYLVMAFGFILTGYYLNLVVFTILILVHELGHCLVAHWLGFEVKAVIIYPYGGITKLKSFMNRDINEELLVAAAGVLMQFLAYLVVCFLHSRGFIRSYTMNLYTLYNSQMIYFNLLPIYPLDGGKIMNLLFSKFFRYQLANWLTIIGSFLVLLGIVGLHIYHCNYSNIMIFGLLFGYVWKFYRKRKYIYQRFLLERYLYSIQYPKIQVIDHERKMYKNRTHIFLTKGGCVSEKYFLRGLFSSKKREDFKKNILFWD